MGNKSCILYIENDKSLVASFQEAVEDQNVDIKLMLAYSMEEAEEKINRELFDGYIIDAMLPRNDKDMKKLEALDEKRIELLDKLVECTDYESNKLSRETISLRSQIDEVDTEIKKLLHDEGGLELVKMIANRHSGGKEPPDALHVPVIFWTARAAPELKEECNKPVDDDYFIWIEKPAEEEVVIRNLVQLLQKTSERECG